MSKTATLHTVYRSLNEPLTIAGAERRLFFGALIMGGATFNFFGSLLGGILMFASLYLLALWATAVDEQILRILLNSSRLKSRYDPAKREPFVAVIRRSES
jgi:hypothetical protein